MRPRAALAGCLLILAADACSLGVVTPAARATPNGQAAGSLPQVAPAPSPSAPLPAYYIESLRARSYPGGKLEVGAVMFRGAGFTKYHMSWPSGGETMTGTISLPDGPGPFPVVVVNHGFIPAERYWIGQDSGIFGDPMAAHGFISVAPNWPGYAGSGAAPRELPPVVAYLVTALDLVSSLSTVAQADVSKVAFVGHSTGGGVSQLAMVVDPRVKAVVAHAPITSDLLEGGRRWCTRRPEWVAPVGCPADQFADHYLHMSPRGYFAAGQPPAMLIQGTADHIIPMASTQTTHDALLAKGIKSRLMWVPGGDHDLVGSDLDAAVAAQEAWIREVLGV